MKLARINTLLVIAIVAVNIYIVLSPLAPAVGFWFQHRSGEKSQALTKTLHAPVASSSNTVYATESHLIVPSMQLDQQIHEGKDMSVLNKGIWLRPNTSTPDKGGNTVIVGHRFTYTNPKGTFYELNRVQIGDEIGIFWDGKRYIYKVSESKTVKADAISVEAQTEKPRLTLYTCTPLWLPKDRLVIVADLVEQP